MAMVFCRGCGKEIHESVLACPHCSAQHQVSSSLDSAVPEGVKGWSWGAFLLNWIWAIGNRTWWGLLTLIPYVGFGIAIWLGFKGREMAWKNTSWHSVEHFNRVQKRWSQWALGITLVASLGIVAAIAVPAYQVFMQLSHHTQP